MTKTKKRPRVSYHQPYSRFPLSKRRITNPSLRRKRRRTLRRTSQSSPSMQIIGRGKDGYILSVSSTPNQVLKIHTSHLYPFELMQKLKEIENAEKYFLLEEREERMRIPSPILREIGGKPPVHISTMTHLEPIPNTKQLTRAQYRHLRDSIQLLHQHGIAHGDIVDNVMLHPEDHQPRIIDWDNAVLHATDTDKMMDMNAFLQFYKVGGPSVR